MEGGEFRRINIVYFLSRNGVVEQPHLVCVHHFYARGVRLCDVKRWLSELRGTNMPDSFAWSYRRRYKNEYVWRDLMDNDLLTPFTDNEYVLKGSMLFSPLPPSTLQSHNYPSLASNVLSCQVASKEEKPTSEESETIQTSKGRSEEVQVELKGNGESPKPSPRTDDESLDLHTAIFKVEEEEKKDKDKDDDRLRQRRHRQPSGCTDVLRALLGCWDSETAEFSLVHIGKDRSGTHKSRGGPGRPSHMWPDDYGNNGCYSNFRESRGSSGRKCGGEEKKVSSMAKYKPVGVPNCSQCGKQFNPEKLHSHMRSCKAVKRGRSAFNKTPIRMDSNTTTEPSGQDFSRESIAGLLTPP